MIKLCGIYVVSLLQLIILSALIGAGIYVGAHGISWAEVKNVMILTPLTALPFLVCVIAPYITYLKHEKIRSAKYWVFGIIYLALIFPIWMHALKLTILEIAGFYNILTAYFGVYVALYAGYGLQTLITIIIAVVMYLVQPKGKS